MSSSYFSLSNVYTQFNACLLDGGDINMDSYLSAYRELLKFFQLMGTVFSFVGSDVKSKLEILENYREKNSEDRDHYCSLKSMIDHESASGALIKSDVPSGSRTFLRLHRGLDFIRTFLQKLGELNDADKTSSVCQESYNNTLAHHHPWLVRQGALVAMCTLPSRGALLLKVCGSEEAVADGLTVLPKMLQAIKEVHKRTDDMYTAHNLHGLP